MAGGWPLPWVVDDGGVVTFRQVAPDAGPPPDPPLARLGPAISGALSGFILEDGGRLQMRLGLIQPRRHPGSAVAGAAGAADGVPLRAGSSRRDAPERARGDGPQRVSPRGRGPSPTLRPCGA